MLCVVLPNLRTTDKAQKERHGLGPKQSAMKHFILAIAAALGVYGFANMASAADDVPHVTNATFKKEVLDSKIPVLIDFYATWCGPCKTSAPHVKQAMKDYAGKVKVVKIDIDLEPGLAKQYGIKYVPTFIVIDQGKEIHRTVGGVDATTLKTFIDDALKLITP